MSMRFLALVGLLFATVSAAQEPASNDQAELSIFVFESLTPAAGVEIRLDGEVAATTNENGAVFLELTPEGHEVALDPPGASETVVIPLSLVPGENAQIIIRSLADGRVTTDIESSNKATESGGTASSGAEELILGDPGTLSALVFSADTGEPVPNARVFISGTPLDLTTDDDGRFSVELNVGVYSLSVLHADHATLTQDGIEIVSGQETAIDIELVPAGLELPEFVVLEPYVKGSLASVIEEQRTSAGVTNVLGSEQISRAGDSDAAGALKRVTGLTLVDGEFIYVRGLGERYATTALNAAAVPSPDPTRRVVPLNLFPASIISSVVVSKSYSADIPAGFGGGAVEIRTKAIPDIPFF
ncbi:MAG: carboxypeptidase regulatory-like domain-containing protein, partial [Pseudomonadota bacterium]